MADNLKAIGLTTRWREVVSSRGQIIEGMMASISMTRKKDSGSFIGQMAESTRDSGKTGSSMDKVSTHLLQANQSVENGQTEREWHGYDTHNNAEHWFLLLY